MIDSSWLSQLELLERRLSEATVGELIVKILLYFIPDCPEFASQEKDKF